MKGSGLSKLLKHDWSDNTINWLEEDMQQAIIMRMKQRGDYGYKFRIVGDMNAGKRNKTTGARLKATGMQAGEPDMRIYVKYGRIVFVELKRLGNKASAAQSYWHEILQGLGFDVWIITADTPAYAVEKMHEVMDQILLKHGTQDVREDVLDE